MAVEDFKHLSPEIKKIWEQIDTNRNKAIDSHELKDESLELLKKNLDKKDISKLDGLESSIKWFLNANKDKPEKKADVEKALIVWNKLYSHTNTSKSVVETSTDTIRDSKSDIYTISQFGLIHPEGCIVDMHAKTDGTDFKLSISGSESTINFSPKVWWWYELKKDSNNPDAKNIVQYLDKDNKIQHGEVKFDGKSIDIKKLDAPVFTIWAMTNLKDLSITSDTLKFEPIKPDGDKFFRVQVPVELPVGRLFGGDRKYTETLYADKNWFLLPNQTLTIYDKRAKENPLRKITVDVAQNWNTTDMKNSNLRGKMNYTDTTITKLKNADIRKEAKIGTQQIESKQKTNKNWVPQNTDKILDIPSQPDSKIDSNISKVLASVEKWERWLQPIEGLADYFIRDNQIVKVQWGKLTPELDLLLSKDQSKNNAEWSKILTSPENKVDKKVENKKSEEIPTKAYVVIWSETFENTLSWDWKQILKKFDYKTTQEYADFNKSMTNDLKASLGRNYGITIDMDPRQPVTKEDVTDTNVTNILTPMYKITQWWETKIISTEDMERVHLFKQVEWWKEVPLFLKFSKEWKVKDETKKDNSSINQETVNTEKADNGPENYLKQIASSVEWKADITITSGEYKPKDEKDSSVLWGMSLKVWGSSYFIDDKLILRDKQWWTELKQIGVTEKWKTSYLTYDKVNNSFVEVNTPDVSIKSSIEKWLLDQKIAKLATDMPIWLTQKKQNDVSTQFTDKILGSIIVDQSTTSQEIDLQKEWGKLEWKEVVLDSKNQNIKSYLYTVGDKIVALSAAQHSLFQNTSGTKELSIDGSFTTKLRTSTTVDSSTLVWEKKTIFDENKAKLEVLETTNKNAKSNSSPEAKKRLTDTYQNTLKILNDQKTKLLEWVPTDKIYTIDKNGSLLWDALITKKIDNKNVRGIQTPDGFCYLDNKVWKTEKDGKVVDQGKVVPWIASDIDPITVLDKKPEIKKGNNWKEVITNTPVIKTSSDARDVTTKRNPGTDGSVINKIRTKTDGDITVIVDKNGEVKTDKDNYKVEKNIDGSITVVKKDLTLSEPGTSWSNSGSVEQSSDQNEHNEKLSDFKWIGYYKKDPEPITFKREWKEDITIKYNKLQSQTDRSQQFTKILQSVKNYKGSNETIKTLNNNITWKNAWDVIRAVQDWSKKLWCNCSDFNDKKFGLQDTLLGINTYASLLLVLDRELKFSNEDNSNIKDLLQNLGQPDLSSNNSTSTQKESQKKWDTSIESKLQFNKRSIDSLWQINITDLKSFNDKEKFGNILNLLKTTKAKQIYINEVWKITIEQADLLVAAIEKSKSNPKPILYLRGLTSDNDNKILAKLQKSWNINIPMSLR